MSAAMLNIPLHQQQCGWIAQQYCSWEPTKLVRFQKAVRICATRKRRGSC